MVTEEGVTRTEMSDLWEKQLVDRRDMQTNNTRQLCFSHLRKPIRSEFPSGVEAKQRSIVRV